MTGMVEKKLAGLEIVLTPPLSPIANYTGFVYPGAWLFISGQICLDSNGDLVAKSKLGSDVSIEDLPLDAAVEVDGIFEVA